MMSGVKSNFTYARLAQLVEYQTYILGVGGSSPSPGTISLEAVEGK